MSVVSYGKLFLIVDLARKGFESQAALFTIQMIMPIVDKRSGKGGLIIVGSLNRGGLLKRHLIYCLGI